MQIEEKQNICDHEVEAVLRRVKNVDDLNKKRETRR